jgi:adenine-specific DNA-methyltransferase
MKSPPTISPAFNKAARAVVFAGDCRSLLASIPDASIRLVVTSPPYNLGKEYEERLDLARYVSEQAEVIRECVRVLHPSGSISRVGNPT